MPTQRKRTLNEMHFDVNLIDNIYYEGVNSLIHLHKQTQEIAPVLCRYRIN